MNVRILHQHEHFSIDTYNRTQTSRTREPETAARSYRHALVPKFSFNELGQFGIEVRSEIWSTALRDRFFSTMQELVSLGREVVDHPSF